MDMFLNATRSLSFGDVEHVSSPEGPISRDREFLWPATMSLRSSNMDDDLRRRYSALLDLVEPRDPYFALVRPLVESVSARHRIRLRPDAAYFLVLNFTEMIFRPYAGDVPTPPAWWGRGEQPSLLQHYRDFSPPTTAARVEKALDVIMNHLDAIPEPDGVSAHQVMRAIDRSWSELSEYFMWG